jgi:hypothetical protein
MASHDILRLTRAAIITPQSLTSEGEAARVEPGDCLEPGGLPIAPHARISEGKAARVEPGDCLEPAAFGEWCRQTRGS